MNSIEFLAVDLGGVLFSEGKSQAREGFIREGYDPDLLHKLLVSEPSMKLRKGEIDDNQFWKEYMVSQVPLNYDVDKIKEIYYNGYLLDNDIVNFIRNATKGTNCKAVAFSGNIPSRVKFLDDKYHFRELFQLECYSFDHCATKPDVKFVEALLRTCYPNQLATTNDIEKMKEFGDKILYLDDNPKDSAPALNYNIKVFNYKRGNISELYQFINNNNIIINTNTSQ